MARTPSVMVELGTSAPDFLLPDVVSGRKLGLEDFQDRKALLVMFICNHCPFVKHIKPELSRFCESYQKRGLAVVAINSNDVVNFPDDHPNLMKKDAMEFRYSFPYLFDESQDVARAYQAACTPDFFLYDEKRRLVYRGQFDDSRPNSGTPVTGADMVRAVEAVLAGKPPLLDQRASLGCNIKWKNS